jgi:hypothetical protein
VTMTTVDCTAYRDHLRPHTAEERAKLEASLLAEGCRDPLVVGVLDGERYLIDGFHRKDFIDAHSLAYEVREVEFSSGEDVLRWIEANDRARRIETGTEKKYYRGRRYNREKNGHGGGRKSSPQSEDLKTAERMAGEEKVGHATIERDGKFAALLDEACDFGLSFLKWPVLTERLKVNTKLLKTLIELGAGGCQEQIERLLAEAGPEKAVSAKAVKKALGIETEEAEDETTDVVAYGEIALGRIAGDAMTATSDQVVKLISMMEEARAGLRAILKSRGEQ